MRTTVRVQAVPVLFIRIKRKYAVLKGCQERDIVRPPAPIQIALELPAIVIILWVFYLIRQRLDYKDVCAD